MRLVVLLCMVLIACTPAAITPPARTLPMASPMAPAHADAQASLGGAGAIFGPGADVGGARYRQRIDKDTVLEVDGGFLNVNNGTDGNNVPDRVAYTGRVGFMWPNEDGTAALLAGAGGGISGAAGSWGSADVGGVISGRNRYIRPVAGAVLGYSAPFGHKTFDVPDDNSTTTLQMPRNVFATLDFGLELGPPNCAFLIGMSAMKFHLLSPDTVDGSAPHVDQGFAGASLGLRVALD